MKFHDRIGRRLESRHRYTLRWRFIWRGKYELVGQSSMDGCFGRCAFFFPQGHATVGVVG